MKKSQDNLSISEFPSKHWENFFSKFAEIDTLPSEQWQATHLIAYFCKRYQEYYQIKYSFKFNSLAPSKSYELVQFRKLGQMLSTNSIIIKEYLDWFFQTQIIFRKKRITSMAFLCDANIVNQFKFKKMAMGSIITIERTTTLPINYQKIVSNLGYDYTSYGQLSFHYKITNNGNGSEKDKELLDQLTANGLDLKILEKVS